MSAHLIYGHENDHASLEVTRASVDEHGVPMTCVSIEDNRCQRDIYFTPPALRALHVAIGIRLVETDRLQTGRPANLVTVHRGGTLTSYHDVVADERIAWVEAAMSATEWYWRIKGNSSRYGNGGTTTVRELAEADVAALLRARGYVVEGG